MLFKCGGPGYPNDLDKCTNTITTNINDKRIEKRGGYESKLYGQKTYFPTTRTYRCDECLKYDKKYKELLDAHVNKLFLKYFIN